MFELPKKVIQEIRDVAQEAISTYLVTNTVSGVTHDDEVRQIHSPTALIMLSEAAAAAVVMLHMDDKIMNGDGTPLDTLRSFIDEVAIPAAEMNLAAYKEQVEGSPEPAEPAADPFIVVEEALRKAKDAGT